MREDVSVSDGSKEVVKKDIVLVKGVADDWKLSTDVSVCVLTGKVVDSGTRTSSDLIEALNDMATEVDGSTLVNDMATEVDGSTLVNDMATKVDGSTLVNDMATEVDGTTLVNDMATEVNGSTLVNDVATEVDGTTLVKGTVLLGGRVKSTVVEVTADSIAVVETNVCPKPDEGSMENSSETIPLPSSVGIKMKEVVYEGAMGEDVGEKVGVVSIDIDVLSVGTKLVDGSKESSSEIIPLRSSVDIKMKEVVYEGAMDEGVGDKVGMVSADIDKSQT